MPRDDEMVDGVYCAGQEVFLSWVWVSSLWFPESVVPNFCTELASASSICQGPIVASEVSGFDFLILFPVPGELDLPV